MSGGKYNASLRFAVLLPIVALASGCDSPAKESTVQDFTRALSDHHSHGCIFFHVSGDLDIDDGSFSIPTSPPGEDPDSAAARNARMIEEFNALVAVGLLRTENVESESAPADPVEGHEHAMSKSYRLTTTGKEAFQDAEERKGQQDVSPGFCAGRYRVDRIKHFSTPGPFGPYTMSEVAYTFSPGDAPWWASDPRLQAAVPQLARALQPGQSGTALLVLTNKGWIHERDFEK